MSHRSHRKKRDKASKSRSQSVVSENFEDMTISSSNGINKTFDIKTSKIMGRYIVATRDLKPGEIVLQEKPLIVGPCTGCKVQCIGCYKNLEELDAFVTCDDCGWPLCSRRCPGIHKEYGHTKIECSLLKESDSSNGVDFADFAKSRIYFHAIAPLRCLILKTVDPSAYDTLMDMEGHDEIRKNIPEVWDGNQKTVVDRIIKDWGLTEFTEKEIHKICGILEVNAFEIGQQCVNIRGLYPTAFLMSHDCIPNTNHCDEEKDYQLTVRASMPISVGQPITLSYAYTLQGSIKRREHLLENKFFECYCQRCADPTELGTYTGALRCPKCKTGYVISTQPLNPEASWSCNNTSQAPEKRCPGYIVTAKSMQLLINRITQEVDGIDCNDIEAMENFLHKYRNVLHPTHYLCLGVKLSLSQLYGKINGYLIDQLSDEMLIRKKEICEEILKVFDIIEPGYTRLRGVTLYELHAPLMILLTRQFEYQSISKSELRTRVKKVIRCLTEASIILSYEPKASSEGIMGVAAKEALSKMKDWEKILGKM